MNNLVVRFLKGSRRLNPPRSITFLTWDLPTVLRALKSPPFEPLSVSPSCLEFGTNHSKIVLKPRQLKCSRPSAFRAQVITLSVLSPSEQDQGLNPLCPVRALKMYIERSAPFRQSEQPCVCFGGHTKGSPVTKQRLSGWIIDAITLAYSSLDQQCPMGARAHLTRGLVLGVV